MRIERRRRLVHLRRRRRDLLEDSVAAIVLMIFALIITPGLGVLALIEVPVALALIGSIFAERRFRRRRREAGQSARRAPRSSRRQG
jgi:Sec-independent protein secretion pathway component TatC